MQLFLRLLERFTLLSLTLSEMHVYKLQLPINKFIKNYGVCPFKRSHHTCTYTCTSSSTGKYLIHVLWLLLFSYSTMSDSLRHHGLQDTRLPCPSPSLRACSNSSIESVMPSNHLVLFCSLLLLPSNFPSIKGLFQ